MEIWNSFRDEGADDVGDFSIPIHFRFHVHRQFVKCVGVVGHESTESLLESESEISVDEVSNTKPGSVHFGRVSRTDSLFGCAQRKA